MLGYIISNKEEINVENYKIKSFDILHKTDLNIFVIENNKVLYKNNIIYNASKNGHIEVLEWFKNSGYEFKDTVSPIIYASQNGNIKVLEWFKNSGYEFEYHVDTITYASQNGHIQVLEWFKNSGYEFKYNNYAILWASKHGHIKVLEWFKNFGYKFKYNKYALDTTCFKILKFFSYKINIKKVIKWIDKIIFIKTLKFKTPQKYIKGYQKN